MKYQVGTMIEIPRAALTAGEIAKEAEFFSFGTNDLTQMTFGFSRDDAAKFLGAYYDHKIYESDPFQHLDQIGVGKLVKMAAKRAAPTRPDLGWASAASTAAIRPPWSSATTSAWTTCPARPSVCPSPVWPPRRQGKKVLLIDADPQGSLTAALGYAQPDQLDTTLSTLLSKILTEQPHDPMEGILHHGEGIDLMPANIELSGLEVSMVNAMNRERVLSQYVNEVKRNYNYVLIDCMPSLGMLTVNALTAADSVLIPAQPQYLSAKGLEQLLQTINKVRRQINPKLKIEGILLTMVDGRTNYAKGNQRTGQEARMAARSMFSRRIFRVRSEQPK
jgi:cellulose biosynthesis protein BcsQ